jgi:hypothetical protein
MIGVSGLRLARRFYDRGVAPLIAAVPHSAGLLGDGSEVLGFDDAISTDHDFGPRVQVFVAEENDARRVHAALEKLPQSFEGFPVAHRRIEVTSASRFFTERIGCDRS